MELNEQQARFLISRGFLNQVQVERLYRQFNGQAAPDFFDLIAERGALPKETLKAARQQFDQQWRSQLSKDLQQLLSRDRWFKPHADYIWESGEKLGEGGMGAVYRVRDRCLGRDGALKLVTKSSPDAIKRFLREVTITSRLDHPSIPPVYEAGVNASGQHYMVMKVIEGQTLQEKIEACHSKGEISPRDRMELIQVLIKVCEAVSYAHSQGILHRDLKPENIMIGRFGEVLVLDWGVARDLKSTDNLPNEMIGRTLTNLEQKKAGLTYEGAFVGTLGYMAPEQLEGQDCLQSDVFSLSLILSEILTNRAAISGESPTELLIATSSGYVSSPLELSRSVPRELDSLARKGLETKLDKRLQSVEALAVELSHYLAGNDLSVHRYSLIERFYRWSGRHPGLLISAAALILILSVSLFIAREFRESERVKNKALDQRDKAEAREEMARAAVLSIRQLELKVSRGLPRTELFKEIDEALEEGGRGYELYLEAARICRLARHREKERELLEIASEKHAPAYEALILLHEVDVESRGQGNFVITPALQELTRRVKERNDVNEFSLVVDAFFLYQDKKFSEAVALLADLEKHTTSFSMGYAMRGTLKANLGDIDGALADLNRAIDCDKNNANAYYNRGMTKSAQGFFQEAVADFDVALRLLPLSPQMYFQRGSAKRKLNDLEGAIKDLSRAIQYDADYAQAYSARGLVKERMGQTAEALSDYNKAISLNPQYGQAFFNRGVLFLKREQLEKAKRDLLTGLKYKGNDEKAYYNLGIIAQKQKQGEVAERNLLKAVEIDPKMANAYYVLGAVWEDRKKLDKAFEYYSKALEVDPKMPHVIYKTGYIHGRKGRFQEALKDFTKGVAMQANFPLMRKSRAVILTNLKRYREAALDFEEHLKLFPNDRGAPALRNFIQKHLGRKSRY